MEEFIPATILAFIAGIPAQTIVWARFILLIWWGGGFIIGAIYFVHGLCNTRQITRTYCWQRLSESVALMFTWPLVAAFLILVGLARAVPF